MVRFQPSRVDGVVRFTAMFAIKLNAFYRYSMALMKRIIMVRTSLIIGVWCAGLVAKVPVYAFVPATPSTMIMARQQLHARRSEPRYAKGSEEDIENQLYEIARRFKLEVFDLDEGIYGLESQDSRYGLEVVHVAISMDADNGGLGLVLTEMAGNADGRGLVLVSQVNVESEPAVQVGDVITGVTAGDTFRERTTGLNYDLTVNAIARAKQEATDGILHLELDRLVERAKVQVEVVDLLGTVHQTIDALAGENLRRLLLRRGIKLYDGRSKRFDMPFVTGDCAGEGICGTCLVNVLSGGELLNQRNSQEELITQGRPSSWRASCRTVVGADNRPGTLRITIHPQSESEDELNPGVKSVSRN